MPEPSIQLKITTDVRKTFQSDEFRHFVKDYFQAQGKHSTLGYSLKMLALIGQALATFVRLFVLVILVCNPSDNPWTSVAILAFIDICL